MALPVNHPTLKEQTVTAFTASAGATPIAAVAGVPFRGKIVKFRATLAGTLTGDATVTVTCGVGAGATVTIPTWTLTASGSVAGTQFTVVPTGANTCNEDDSIVFTPASGTGTNIPCTFQALIQSA